MIIRAPHDQNYTAIRREGLQDKRLSWAARGMWAFLLSKPDGWEVSVAYLVKQGDMSDRLVRRVLKELAERGYIVRRTRKSVAGRYEGVEVEVHELPQTEEAPGQTERRNVQPGLTRDNGKNAQVAPDGELPHDGETARRRIAPLEKSESLDDREKAERKTSSAIAVKLKPCDDPLTKQAHALTVLAFEQPIKPVIAVRGSGDTFSAVLGIIKSHLHGGHSVQKIKRTIEAGVEVWSVGGLATAMARANPKRRTDQGRSRVEQMFHESQARKAAP